MPRTSAELRARMCQFAYSDGRRCRLPRAASGGPYCHSHAAKIHKEREQEFVATLLTQPVAHNAFTSTSLTFMLARLFTLVANGHVSPKTSNALLRITDGLRKTLRNTTQEFLHCYDSQGLRTLVENLHREHERFLRLAECDSLDEAARSQADETPIQTTASGSSQDAPNPELIPVQPGRPRPTPAPTPEELLQQLEQRLAAR